MPTLAELNAATPEAFTAMLDGIYEHSPWIGAAALPRRPFRTLAELSRAMVEVVREAGRERQVELIRAHPELAGKAMVSGSLTEASTGEQSLAGLTHCTPQEFAELQQLNADYNRKFGWPFILAVRGADGRGLNRHEIIAAMRRRLAAMPEVELAECLRNIHRIAELRLSDRFGFVPDHGDRVLGWATELARHTDTPGELTVTYCRPAHRACAADLAAWMRGCGFDEVLVDAVGNVVGRYRASAGGARALGTGSHYDTVRNGGRYDGRLGILAPMAAVEALARARRRLSFDIEVVGFAEEEGVRFASTFLGSSALTGRFDRSLLDARDTDGVAMGDAMREAGLAPDGIAALARDPAKLLGFVEIHIEQGPVLLERDLPLGVVTSINGSVRVLVEIEGVASHAGTTPMDLRRDAACAAAEVVLEVERRCASVPGLVGTVGKLEVPNGSINVVPGRCAFSLDIRAPQDAPRDAAVADILASIAAICTRRGLSYTTREVMRVAAAPSDPRLQSLWEASVAALGMPLYRMPSGAGHDAMKMAELGPQAMLFVRCGNGGLSHNPLETMTNHDAHWSVLAFLDLLDRLDAGAAR